MSDVLTAHQRRIYLQIRAQAEADFGLDPNAPIYVCFREEVFPSLFDAFPQIAPGGTGHYILPQPRYHPREEWRLWAHRVGSVCGLLRWQGRAHTRWTYWRFCLEDERQRAKLRAQRILIGHPRIGHGLRLLSTLLGTRHDPRPRGW